MLRRVSVPGVRVGSSGWWDKEEKHIRAIPHLPVRDANLYRLL